MVTLTYIVLVLVVLTALGVVLRTRKATSVRGIAFRDRLRGALIGTGRLSDDLVERMAICLAANTTAFGTSFAVPGHLTAVLPRGVYEAAAAVKAQLTVEVLDRFTAVMAERVQRGSPQREFALPSGYELRLVLSSGAAESIAASFEPAADVPVLAGRGGPPAPVHRPEPGERRSTPTRSFAAPVEDMATTRRSRPGAGGEAFVLCVDGVAHAQRQLGGGTTVLQIGRSDRADLRCPDGLTDVSRAHAELTLAAGTVYVADKNSANGSWLQRGDDPAARLVAGEPVAVRPGDVVWLDEERRVKVTRA